MKYKNRPDCLKCRERALLSAKHRKLARAADKEREVARLKEVKLLKRLPLIRGEGTKWRNGGASCW